MIQTTVILPLCHIRGFIFLESSWFIKMKYILYKNKNKRRFVFSFLTETEKERLNISCLHESNIQSIINLSFLWPTSLHLFSLSALVFSDNPEQMFLKSFLSSETNYWPDFLRQSRTNVLKTISQFWNKLHVLMFYFKSV